MARSPHLFEDQSLAVAGPQSLRYYITVLRNYSPTKRPVRVRFVKRLRWFGDCCVSDDNRFFDVRISKELDKAGRIEALAHEWAHARAWRGRLDHSDEWGREYARAYRLLVDHWRPSR